MSKWRSFRAYEDQQRAPVAGAEIAGVEVRRDAGVCIGEVLSGDAAEAERVVDHGAGGAEVEGHAEHGAVDRDLRVDAFRSEALGDLPVEVRRDVVEQVSAEHAVQHFLGVDAAVHLAHRVQLGEARRQRVDDALQGSRRGVVDQHQQLVELAKLADEGLEVVERRRAARQHAEHVDVEAQARQRQRGQQRKQRRRADHCAMMAADPGRPASVRPSHRVSR